MTKTKRQLREAHQDGGDVDMSKKPKRKIALPTDRDGVPINVGDVIMWDDGTLCKVDTLTFLGDEFADTIGSWVVNIGTDAYDNPQGGKLIWREKR